MGAEDHAWLGARKPFRGISPSRSNRVSEIREGQLPGNLRCFVRFQKPPYSALFDRLIPPYWVPRLNLEVPPETRQRRGRAHEN